MKSLVFFSFLFIGLNISTFTYAQEYAMELEREIKLSNNYFHSQATAPNKDKAIELAKTLLQKEIEFLEYLAKSNKSISSIEIQYIWREIGPSVRVIAYVPKNILLTKELEKKNISREVLSLIKLEISNTDNNRIDTPTKFPEKLLSIKNIKSCEESWDQLNRLKRSGILVFSTQKDSFDELENCYVIVCKNNNVSAILQKGNHQRADLLSCMQVDLRNLESDPNNIIIYAYVF